jgi:type IV secretion system protein VirB9
MKHTERFSLLLLVLMTGVAAASQDPASSPAAAPPELPQSAADGIAPDPAASSLGPSRSDSAPTPAVAHGPVALPPAVPPPAAPLPADCNTPDCAAAADKAVVLSVHPGKKTPTVAIGPAAQRALTESHTWAENPAAMPSRDASGRMIFPFNESVPTIVCAPLHVCDIQLQAGEQVQGTPHIGDSIRWKVSPAVSGGDDNKVIHLIVKPTESGLDTNLMIATDRHTYHLRLVSSTSRYVSSIGFSYPEEDQHAWGEFSRAVRGGGGSALGGPDMPTVAVNRLNFNYKIKVVKGKPTFKPLRAMDDGYHTYVAMNEDLPQQEAPALIGIGPAGEEKMINYRVKGNLYIIDGTVFKMAFIAGVGREQQRIELTRDSCKARGWLGICWDAKE